MYYNYNLLVRAALIQFTVSYTTIRAILVFVSKELSSSCSVKKTFLTFNNRNRNEMKKYFFNSSTTSKLCHV